MIFRPLNQIYMNTTSFHQFGHNFLFRSLFIFYSGLLEQGSSDHHANIYLAVLKRHFLRLFSTVRASTKALSDHLSLSYSYLSNVQFPPQARYRLGTGSQMHHNLYSCLLPCLMVLPQDNQQLWETISVLQHCLLLFLHNP